MAAGDAGRDGALLAIEIGGRERRVGGGVGLGADRVEAAVGGRRPRLAARTAAQVRGGGGAQGARIERQGAQRGVVEVGVEQTPHSGPPSAVRSLRRARNRCTRTVAGLMPSVAATSCGLCSSR